MRGKGIIDISDQVFSRLYIVERIENDKNGNTQFLCLCSCGNKVVALSGNIRTGKTQSCGCLNRDTHTKDPGVANSNRVWRQYRNNAKQRGIEWRLTKELFGMRITQNCYYCDKSPSNVQCDAGSNGPFVYSGLDRLDNELDYVPFNVVACCNTCNISKGTHSVEDFINHAHRIWEHTAW